MRKMETRDINIIIEILKSIQDEINSLSVQIGELRANLQTELPEKGEKNEKEVLQSKCVLSMD